MQWDAYGVGAGPVSMSFIGNASVMLKKLVYICNCKSKIDCAGKIFMSKYQVNMTNNFYIHSVYSSICI